MSRKGIDELGIDPDSLPIPAHASFEDIPDTKLFGYFLDFNRFPLVRES